MQQALKKVEQSSYIAALLMIGVSFFHSGKDGVISSLLGAVLVLAGFKLWVAIAKRIFAQENTTKTPLFFMVLAKFLLIGGVLWALITKFSLEPLAFFLGLSSIVAAILFETIRGTFTKA